MFSNNRLLAVIKQSVLLISLLAWGVTTGCGPENENPKQNKGSSTTNEDPVISPADWKAKATNGDREAQYQWALELLKNRGREDQAAKAAEHLANAAGQGHAGAMFELGLLYRNGIGVNLNTEIAEQWFQRAAGNGYSKAEALLKNLDLEREQSGKKLVKEKESIEAYNKGVSYVRGEGVEPSIEKAVGWFLKSAEMGNHAAQYNLGVLHLTGDGVELNYETATEWFLKSAEQGNRDSQYNLAVLYAVGKGMEQDYEESYKWVKLAAEQGLPDAQYNLAALYFKGMGVEQNINESVRWYRKAAEQGNPIAQSNLGVFYINGEGVEKDTTEAFKWFKLSAERGYHQGMYNLASMYAKGEGIEADPIKAYMYYGIAADLGDREAQLAKNGLEMQLSPNEITQAIDQASQFRVDKFKEMVGRRNSIIEKLQAQSLAAQSPKKVNEQTPPTAE